MPPVFKLRARARPTTDYERWINFNTDQDPSSPPKYGPDRKHRYVDDSSVRFAPNRQLMFNDQRHMLSEHPHHHRRIPNTQGLVRGITFFSAVLVVVLVIRMFAVSLIRAAQRRRDIDEQIQKASQRQQIPATYEDNNELNEL